jgi:hypothetical protein
MVQVGGVTLLEKQKIAAQNFLGTKVSYTAYSNANFTGREPLLGVLTFAYFFLIFSFFCLKPAKRRFLLRL